LTGLRFRFAAQDGGILAGDVELDVDIFKPLDRGFCRAALNLPLDRRIVLFGAIGGSKDLRKGYDLLLGAFRHWAARKGTREILCAIFGQNEPHPSPELPVTTRWMGFLTWPWGCYMAPQM
jgi:hypothetical protein